MSSTGPTFRTPADVRAVPNEQWEQWLRTDAVPFRAFACERWTQRALREVVNATGRRLA